MDNILQTGIKKIVRLYNKNGYALADLLTLEDEKIDETQPLTIFDPVETWKQTTLTDFTAKELLVPVFVEGEQVYESPKLEDIREYMR